MSQKREIHYICDKKLLDASSKIPNIGRRAIIVHSLISSYGLLSKCKICPAEDATEDDLMSFHSNGYIECLKKAQDSQDLEKLTNSEIITDYNLGYDCPLFENILEFAKVIAGGSLTAAKKLTEGVKINEMLTLPLKNSADPKSYRKFAHKPLVMKELNEEVFDLPGNLTLEEEEEMSEHLSENQNKFESEPLQEKKNVALKEPEGVNDVKASEGDQNVYHNCIRPAPVAVNWHGGWHHAQRDEAEGFCYVNDIVIAIHHLLKYYKRILYVDLDIHHGNGVENAFLFSSRVFTFSIHKYEPGFYPASGSLNDIGQGNGKYYCVNIPLKEGVTNISYINTFFKIATTIMERYKPECVVVQCGADSVAGDPLGGFNITPLAIGKCLKYILDQNIPTLVLGGGGYNLANVARCWAYLTSIITNCPISDDIPENNCFHMYGPDFSLNITPTLRRNENTPEYLQQVIQTVLRNLKNIQSH